MAKRVSFFADIILNTIFHDYLSLAQLVEHLTVVVRIYRIVAGSIPAAEINFC